MNPMDYKFNVGDKVVTVYGEVGRITDICYCDSCKSRGFYELTWTTDDENSSEYITINDAQYDFDAFCQIGQYKFNNALEKDRVLQDISHYEKQLNRARRRLKVIEELEREEAQKLMLGSDVKKTCESCEYCYMVAETNIIGRHNSFMCLHPNHRDYYIQPFTVCDSYAERKG